MFLRIFIREAFAAAGPLLIVYFEDLIVCTQYSCPDSREGKFFIILALIVLGSLLAYGLGAFIGVIVEAMVIYCADCCCGGNSGRTADELNNVPDGEIPEQYWI